MFAMSICVNVLAETAPIFPFLGAFVTDSFLGQYWTVLALSIVYLLGLSLCTPFTSLASFKHLSM
jgi:dipeptide/tripeptide permease